MNWADDLFDYRQQFVPDSQNLKDNKEFYFLAKNSDTLVITAGDSWTFGDSLPEESRLDQVYGRILAEHFNSDWVNIGSRGRANSWTLKCLEYLAKIVKDHYNKVIVVVTLTENGRDVQTPYTFPLDYGNLGRQTGDSVNYFENVLKEAEMFWSNQIKNIKQTLDCVLVVGQNFVFSNLTLPADVKMLDTNWIEKLADYQGYQRPIRTNLVTSWVFDSFPICREWVNISTSTYHEWVLTKLDLANQVNRWLDHSKLNQNELSKHPVKKGHEIWANYLLENLRG
jgi:lysophospholipase L1-like esterase